MYFPQLESGNKIRNFLRLFEQENEKIKIEMLFYYKLIIKFDIGVCIEMHLASCRLSN
jgi:hypothetical protein